jgi:hypothetical protein
LQFGQAGLQLQALQAYSSGNGSWGGSNGSGVSNEGSARSSSSCNSDIQAASNPAQLLQVLQHHADDMSLIDVSAAFARAAKLTSKHSSGSSVHTQPAVQQQLRQELQQLAARLHSQQQQQPGGDPAAVAASALAAIIHACGSLRLPAVTELLLSLLLQQETLQGASTRSLSNVIHGIAKAKAAVQDSQLQQLLAAFSAQLPAANAQDISNVLWAVADMGQRMPAQQLSLYLNQFESVVESAQIQAVKDVMWAVATMKQKIPDPQLHLFMDRVTQQDCLAAASAQHVSNSLWAVATMQGTVSKQQLRLLLDVFMQKLPSAGPQGINDVLWAVVAMGMGRQLQQQQLWGMMHQFRQLLHAAEPQHISALLWALAKLQATAGVSAGSPAGQAPGAPKPVISTGFLGAAVDSMVSKQARLSARDVALTLWACGELLYYPQKLLDLLRQKELEKPFERMWCAADPKSAAIMAYACARLGFSSGELPGALLQQAVQMLDSSSGSGSSSSTSRCSSASSSSTSRCSSASSSSTSRCSSSTGGCSSGVSGWPGDGEQPVLSQEGSSSSSRSRSSGGYSGSAESSSTSRSSAETACKQQGPSKPLSGRMLRTLCWVAAMLDLRECIPQVLQLAAACGAQWEGLDSQSLLQLYQVHLWLQDCAAADQQRGGSQQQQQQKRGGSQQQQQQQQQHVKSQDSQHLRGLSGVLAPEQLEQCRASWQQQLQHQVATGRSSKRQRTVFLLLQELSDVLQWQQAPAFEQLTPDGNYSIDIAAVTANGVKIAIEVNGPWHYLQGARSRNVLDGPTRARYRALAARGYRVVSVAVFKLRKANTEQRRAYLLSKIQAVES